MEAREGDGFGWGVGRSGGGKCRQLYLKNNNVIKKGILMNDKTHFHHSGHSKGVSNSVPGTMQKDQIYFLLYHTSSSHFQALVTTDLFSVPRVLPGSECYINGIIK